MVVGGMGGGISPKTKHCSKIFYFKNRIKYINVILDLSFEPVSKSFGAHIFKIVIRPNQIICFLNLN